MFNEDIEDKDVLDAMNHVDWFKVDITEAQSFGLSMSFLREASNACVASKEKYRESFVLYILTILIVVAGLFLNTPAWVLVAVLLGLVAFKVTYDWVRLICVEKIMTANKNNVVNELVALSVRHPQKEQ